MPIVELPNGTELEFPEGTSQDVMRSSIQKNFPEYAKSSSPKMSKEDLDYLLGTNRTPVDTLRDVGSGALTGLGKGGQFIGELMEKIPGFQKLQQKVQSATGISVPRVNMDEMFAPVASPNKSVGGQIAKGVGQYLPYALAGGATIPGQIAAGAASGAALTEPDEQNAFGLLPKGKMGGALEGAIINALTGGAAKGLEALRPAKMFRGNLTPEELTRNLDVTKGTETGLGDVIDSPFLKKRLENTLTATPFSGANESLQRTGKEVVKRGEDIMQRLLGDNSPENVPSDIAEQLTNEFKRHQTDKNALYTDANKIAEDVGLKLELPAFAKKANDVAGSIDKMDLLKSEPDIAKIYNKMQNYKNPVKQERITGAIVDTNGKPMLDRTDTSYPTLEEANLLKGKLNQYAKMAAKSPTPSERNLSRVYGELAGSLKQDINQGINSSGSDNLKEAYRAAEDNYAKNFSPFLDKDIYKYVSGNADPEKIVQNFIKTSPNQDLANQLGKLAERIPDQGRRQLAYSYLSRALDNEGNLNPNKLGVAIKKLGANQLKKLVPDQGLRKDLLDYSKLTKMNQEAQNLMFNPNTGARNRDAIVTGILSMLGHGASGNYGAVLAPAAAIGIGRGATKALTSESLRDSLVKEMIKNRTRFNTPAKTIGAETLMNALRNSFGKKDQANGS